MFEGFWSAFNTFSIIKFKICMAHEKLVWWKNKHSNANWGKNIVNHHSTLEFLFSYLDPTLCLDAPRSHP